MLQQVIPGLQSKVGALVLTVDAEYRSLSLSTIADSSEGKLKRRLLDLLSTSAESLMEVRSICLEASELESNGSDLSELAESISGEDGAR